MIIDRLLALKLIILFALINSSIYFGLSPQGFSILKISMVLALFLSVFLLFTFFLKREKHYSYIHPYFKFILFLLFIWSSFTIFRSISSNTTDLISLFGTNFLAWTWITPLAIIFGVNVYNWASMFNFLSKLLGIGIILSIILLFINEGRYGIGVAVWLKFYPILLITYFYQKPVNQKIIIIAVVTYIIMSFVNSSRTNGLILLFTFFFFSIELFKYKWISSYKKIIFATFLALSLLLITMQVSVMYNAVANNEEASTDTRSFLYEEVFSDMSDSELLIGRGASGTYYSRYFDVTARAGITGGDAANRDSVETGYLQMILKGGYIMVVLYLMILIPAAYLGIFKSKNVISRMSGYIIFIYLLLWIVSLYPIYSTEYILLWMLVGSAISSTARKVTDNDLKIYINRGCNK